MEGEPSSSRRTIMKLLGSVGIGTLTLSSTTVGSQESIVPERFARRLAEAKVEQLAGIDELDMWERGGVASPELFYSPVPESRGKEYEPAVYVFPIENSGEDVGYITVSARTFLSPILAYGTGPAPQRRLSSVSGYTALDRVSVGDRFIYSGGMSYGVEATSEVFTGIQRRQNKYVVDLKTGIAYPQRNAPSVRDLELEAEYGRKQWKTMDRASPEQWVGGVETQSHNTDDRVTGVPNWSERADSDSWDGCSPIAASMAIGYHEETSYSDRDTLIVELRDTMSTRDIPFLGEGLTLPGDIPKGIRNFNPSEPTYPYDSPKNNMSDIGKSRTEQTKNQIENDNPLLVSTFEIDFVGHSETVVGYKDRDDFKYRTHDTYGDTNWITHKNWVNGFTTPVLPQV